MPIKHIYLYAAEFVNFPPADQQAVAQDLKLLSQGGLTVSAVIHSLHSPTVTAAGEWCTAQGWQITQLHSPAKQDNTNISPDGSAAGGTNGKTGIVLPMQGTTPPGSGISSTISQDSETQDKASGTGGYAGKTEEVDTLLLTTTQQVSCLPPSVHMRRCIHWILTPRLEGPITGHDLDTTSVFLPSTASDTPPTALSLPPTCLLQSLTHLQAALDAGVLVVGYAMSKKRERELATAGLLNFTPMDGIVFMPLDLGAPLESQPTFHILLHKFSDELKLTDSGRVEYSDRVKRVTTFLSTNPSIRVVDPLSNTAIVLDRMTFTAAVQRVLMRPEWGTSRFAIPKTLVCECLSDVPGLPSRLEEEDMHPPYIVKVAPACGVAGSHAMVLMRSHRAWPAAQVSFPAVIQQYINHAQALYKVYVLGDHVKVARRKSIPDIQVMTQDEDEAAELRELFHEFDSLASLPLGGFPGAVILEDAESDPKSATSRHAGNSNIVSDSGPKPQTSSSNANSNDAIIGLDVEGVELVAEALRCELGLRLFGFDVVVCQQSGTHYIIDVNYFPNYREVKDAGRLLRKTLLEAYET